jgi:SAM-dependent methyltransferase
MEFLLQVGTCCKAPATVGPFRERGIIFCPTHIINATLFVVEIIILFRESNASMTGSIDKEESRIRDVYTERDRLGQWWRDKLSLTLVEAHELERDFAAFLEQSGVTSLEGLKILDVGCGTGGWLLRLIQWGANAENLAGIDLLEDRVERARTRLPDFVDLRCGSATDLPWSDGTFHLVYQSVVFSSVLDPQVRKRIAGGMLRVTKPGGLVISHDLRIGNPRNRNVVGIGKRELSRLFNGRRLTLKSTTLAPPIARRLARYSEIACILLAKVPFMRTHYFASVTK